MSLPFRFSVLIKILIDVREHEKLMLYTSEYSSLSVMHKYLITVSSCFAFEAVDMYYI
jgi:hypothetical protein